MIVESINLGMERSIDTGSRKRSTGIWKMPVEGPVQIGPRGIGHDFIGDRKNHGGPDQALYLYGADDYRWWAGELGQLPSPGTFGENLTIGELASASMLIGDRLKIGEVVLEVTAPRIPCGTLTARMGDSEFAARFRMAERPGMYCRVLREGTIRVGDAVERQVHMGEEVSILDAFRIYYKRRKARAEIERILRAPISRRARASLERDLAKAAGPGSA